MFRNHLIYIYIHIYIYTHIYICIYKSDDNRTSFHMTLPQNTTSIGGILNAIAILGNLGTCPLQGGPWQVYVVMVVWYMAVCICLLNQMPYKLWLFIILFDICLNWFTKTAYICTLKNTISCGHVIWHGQEHVLHPLLGGQGPVDVEDAQTLLWHHPSLGRLYAWGVSIYRSTSCSLDHSKLTHCWNQQTYSFCQKKVFLNTMASWLGWCIHVLLFVGLPLQKKLNISQHDNSTACQATQVGAAFWRWSWRSASNTTRSRTLGLAGLEDLALKV